MNHRKFYKDNELTKLHEVINICKEKHDIIRGICCFDYLNLNKIDLYDIYDDINFDNINVTYISKLNISEHIF